jgi:hypothetical protein
MMPQAPTLSTERLTLRPPHQYQAGLSAVWLFKDTCCSAKQRKSGSSAKENSLHHAANVQVPPNSRTSRSRHPIKNGPLPTFSIATNEVRSLRLADRRPVWRRFRMRTFRPFAHAITDRGHDLTPSPREGRCLPWQTMASSEYVRCCPPPIDFGASRAQ